MSAALIGQLLSACAGAYSAASSAVWWAASLPPTCRESLTHAALTCSGATPRYFTPGFGPLALAWGWLLLGVLLGLLFRRAAAALVALAGGHAPQCAPCSWEALLRELAARTEDPNRHEVLQYLLQGGEAAVRDLSQATKPHTYSADGPSPHGQHGRGCCGPSPCECACSPTERASLAPLHAACARVGGATSSCGRHRRVDTAPSPWQTNWGGCAPWAAVRGRPGAASATCATCTCANAVIATRHPPGRAARPPSGHGRCRNPFGHPQRHNPFRVSAGRCAPAALGSSGASDAP